jgi:integrase
MVNRRRLMTPRNNARSRFSRADRRAGSLPPYMSCRIGRYLRHSPPVDVTNPNFLLAEHANLLTGHAKRAFGRGGRTHAILLLLARLGLRAGDVTALRLDDLAWHEGTLRLCGKGRREVRLPLPQDVGDALLAYIERVRPRVPEEGLSAGARAVSSVQPLGLHCGGGPTGPRTGWHR